MTGVCWDITDRKKDEEALKNSEEKLRYASTAADIGMWHWDFINSDTTWSDKCKELFGYPSDYVMTYEDFLESIHEEDRQHVHAAVQKVLLEKTEYFVEMRVILPDGSMRWVMAKGRGYYNDHGKPISMHGIAMDISESKQTGDSLRLAKEEWERTFDSVPELIAILDNHHRILRVNESLARRLGHKTEECVGLHCYDVVHGTSVPPEFCPHSRTIMDGLEHSEEVHVDRFGGDFQVTITPFLDEDGNRIGSIHIAHDITERKRMEDELKTLNEELEVRVMQRTEELRKRDQMLLIQSRQAAMGEMIGNIAHQWRQPLNILGLKVQQMLLFYDLGDFSREFLEKNVSSSMECIQHMSKTIDDFRNYFSPDKEKVNFVLSESIENTLSLIEDSFKNQNISIEVIVKNDPVINGYQNEFAQVLLNILNNARDVLAERIRTTLK